MKIDLNGETVDEIKILRVEIADKINALCDSSEYHVNADVKDFIDRLNFASNEPIKFEDDANNANNKEVVDILNGVITDHHVDTTYLGRIQLFVNHDDEKLCINVPNIYNYGGSLGYFINYDRIHFKIDNSKDVLDYIYKYFKENPIVFVLDSLNFSRKTDTYKKLISNSHFITILNKAINDFAELKLIVQACNI